MDWVTGVTDEARKTQCRPWADFLKGRLAIRDWQWWQLPPALRSYVAVVVVAAVVMLAVTAGRTAWRQAEAAKFILLSGCGAVSVASARRSAPTDAGGTTVDFSTTWVLPVAILLPSVYAAVAPVVLIAIYYFVRRGVPHRHVFTAATISLSYLLAAR